MKDKISILLIGHHSSKVSGSALSFRRLYENLKIDERVELQLIDTSRKADDLSSLKINLFVAILPIQNI